MRRLSDLRKERKTLWQDFKHRHQRPGKMCWKMVLTLYLAQNIGLCLQTREFQELSYHSSHFFPRNTIMADICRNREEEEGQFAPPLCGIHFWLTHAWASLFRKKDVCLICLPGGRWMGGPTEVQQGVKKWTRWTETPFNREIRTVSFKHLELGANGSEQDQIRILWKLHSSFLYPNYQHTFM